MYRVNEVNEMKVYRKSSQVAILATIVLTCWVASPHAYGSICLYLTPENAFDEGNQNSTEDIEDYLELTYGITDDPKYKIDYDDKKEEGDLLGSYSTLFSSDSAFTITYDSGPVITGTVYLLVKNGRHIPAWYLFDITGWNGVCGIEGTGFWEGIKGSISHVAIYGEEGVIPEPTMLLVWSGLAGMALQVRRRRV